jgi:NADH-quinone oxidoreductase subunit F
MKVVTPSVFSAEVQERIESIVSRYERKQAALLPLLNLAQDEFGYVTPEAERFVSEYLEVPLVHVREVVSFYTLLRTTPPAKCRIALCTTTSCVLGGADRLHDHLKARLTASPEPSFSVESVECLGACEFGPVAQVNDTYAGKLNEEKLDQILERGGSQAADWCDTLPDARLEKGEPLLSDFFRKPGAHLLEEYQRRGGFEAAKKVVSKVPPGDVIETVKKSNLRGLGGAGFSVGMKWSFVPKETAKPKYLVVNADEGEPGTFKDKYLMVHAPHLLLEGMILASYAVGIHKAYIYIRKEYEVPYRRMQAAVDEAYARGILGKSVLGTGFALDVVVHRGAGAYICGEESALLESLEGKKGFPRLKPPFPAVSGLFGCPTVINNVETLSYLPFIFTRGAEWFAGLGSEKNGGMKLYCVSGRVVRPGVYELPMGTPLRDIIFKHAGGIANGGPLKAVIPGGISANILTADEIDVKMDFDSLKAAGTMLGSAGVMVFDESVCMVKALYYATKFFAHESCGQCSPCREGTGWVHRIVGRIMDGKGRVQDLDQLLDIAAFIGGNTICAFGDAAAMPVTSYIKKFRAEFEYHIEHKRCDL